jgi:hypothetical protein
VELKITQKQFSHLQQMTCLGITGGMRSTPTSASEVMLILPSLHLFIKQEATEADNRQLRNRCSYVPNLEHSEVLIRMTPPFLEPSHKCVTLNIFDRIFLSISLQKRPGLRNVLIWLHRIDSLSFRESYALGSHTTVF